MVAIHSQEEYNFVRSIMDSSYGYWLGGIQVANKIKSFTWLDGSAFNFSRWYNGRPGNENSYNCLAVMMNRNGWFDQPCQSTYRQICEKVDNDYHSLVLDKFPEHYINGLTRNQVKLSQSLEEIKVEIDRAFHSHKAHLDRVVEDLRNETKNAAEQDLKYIEQSFSSRIHAHNKTILSLDNKGEKNQKEVAEINLQIKQFQDTYAFEVTFLKVLVSLLFVALLVIVALFVFIVIQLRRKNFVFRRKSKHYDDTCKHNNIYDELQLKGLN
ncbi:lung surfactant protein A-like protein [Dinothrombium tinctorium]|uniref:Lung surfactant protein A-like protein n=1 Tax=Dinothrombium tinctorium TaxID=1965070 RepID=A0A3S4QNM4_9ACAR|nr:lung surfactant protein A-like protein [Dinothrombium tinctorium]RWS05603.1 lung surfactant protein A-like protein [Dinothrombium tinctorium]RWS05797.1 lung surfactant protein A-like protein [Dinothrombium tinctorium]